MRQVVWKYQVYAQHEQSISLPIGAKVLSFQSQLGDWGSAQMFIWAAHDPDEGRAAQRQFILLGTGYVLEGREGMTYVGTAQQGPFAWHLFELPS